MNLQKIETLDYGNQIHLTKVVIYCDIVYMSVT